MGVELLLVLGAEASPVIWVAKSVLSLAERNQEGQKDEANFIGITIECSSEAS